MRLCGKIHLSRKRDVKTPRGTRGVLDNRVPTNSLVIQLILLRLPEAEGVWVIHGSGASPWSRIDSSSNPGPATEDYSS